MSDTSALASRFARRLGSRARNGLIGRLLAAGCASRVEPDDGDIGDAGIPDVGGGVTGGTETGWGAGGAPTAVHGVCGVGRRGGNAAPRAGDGIGGVLRGEVTGVERTVACRGGVACRAGAAGAGRGGVGARVSAGIVARGGVAVRCARGGTNGGGVGRAPNAAPIASTGCDGRGGVAVRIPTGMTPLQVEQRARTPPGGTLAGSTRNIVEH